MKATNIVFLFAMMVDNGQFLLDCVIARVLYLFHLAPAEHSFSKVALHVVFNFQIHFTKNEFSDLLFLLC